MQQNNGDNWLVTNSAAMLIPEHTTQWKDTYCSSDQSSLYFDRFLSKQSNKRCLTMLRRLKERRKERSISGVAKSDFFNGVNPLC